MAGIRDQHRRRPPNAEGQEAREARIVFLIGSGLSLRAVATIAGVSKSTVDNVAKAATPRSPPRRAKAARVPRRFTRKSRRRPLSLRWTGSRRTWTTWRIIDELAKLLVSLDHAVKAVQLRHDFLVKAREESARITRPPTRHQPAYRLSRRVTRVSQSSSSPPGSVPTR